MGSGKSGRREEGMQERELDERDRESEGTCEKAATRIVGGHFWRKYTLEGTIYLMKEECEGRQRGKRS